MFTSSGSTGGRGGRGGDAKTIISPNTEIIRTNCDNMHIKLKVLLNMI